MALHGARDGADGGADLLRRGCSRPRLTREAAARMRLFVSGSAPLLAETHRSSRRADRAAHPRRYGMTETGMNASNPYDGERRAGTVGSPLPGVEVRVTDPRAARRLPGRGRDDRGARTERVPGLLADAGEDARPSCATTASSSPAISARIDARGYVTIVGRGKDLIISGGYNVYPKEVGAAIDALPGVVGERGDRRAASGLRRGRHGGAWCARRRAAGREADGRRRCADSSPVQAARSGSSFVDELPRNAMGKVQKNLLRARYAATFAG